MGALFEWLVDLGTTGAARNAGRVLAERRRAERAVAALVLRLEPPPGVDEAA